MKILLPIDGSAYSGKVLQEVMHRPWPPHTEVRILSVVHAFPAVPDPLLVGRALHLDSVNEERRRAPRDVAEAGRTLTQGAPVLNVSTQVREGSPREEILRDAAEWGADLIMLGSHGNGASLSFLLGSVAHEVALHAPCSVEIVRDPAAMAPAQPDLLPA